jgi:hypothetical protein
MPSVHVKQNQKHNGVVQRDAGLFVKYSDMVRAHSARIGKYHLSTVNDQFTPIRRCDALLRDSSMTEQQFGKHDQHPLVGRGSLF